MKSTVSELKSPMEQLSRFAVTKKGINKTLLLTINLQ